MASLRIARIGHMIARVGNSGAPMMFLCLLCCLIIYQNWQRSHPEQAPAALKAGQHVSAVTVQDIDSNSVRLDWTSGTLPTILYVFSPDCVWCKKNLTAQRAVVSGTAGRYRFIGLSTTKDGLPEYIAANHIDYPVYVITRGSTAQRILAVRGTPETIVISRSGVVQSKWSGAYGEETRKQISSLLAVSIPPLPLSPSAPPTTPE